MAVLKAAGLESVARELLDCVNPTGSWTKPMPAEEPGREDAAGNDAGRWSEHRRTAPAEA